MLLCLLAAPMLADAERPTQDPQKAAVIVVGWVNSISKTSQGESDYYTFWVNVESVESGSGVASGDLISVKTFQWARPGPGKVGGSGHAGRPVIGDKIRLYANPNGSGFSGNYPHWFDVLEHSTRPPQPYTGETWPAIELNWWYTFWSTPAFYMSTGAVVLLGVVIGVMLWNRKRTPPNPLTPAVEA
jgi:hypothetical protein